MAGSFFTGNETIYTDTNPPGPGSAPVTGLANPAPSSFFAGGPIEAAVNTGANYVRSFNGRNWEVTAQAGDYTFAQLANKPTTLAGYGITDNVVINGGSVPVGIGTASPAYPLHVVPAITTSGRGLFIDKFNDTEGGELALNGATKTWAVDNYSGTLRFIKYPGNNGASAEGVPLTIDAAGNVGIGNTFGVSSFSHALQVLSPSVTAVRFGSAASGIGGGYLLSSADSQALLSGGAEFVGSSWIARATVASMTNLNGGAVTFHTNGGLTPGATFNPIERMRIDASGNVGIGTTAGLGVWGKLIVGGSSYTGVNLSSSDAGGVNLHLAANSNSEARINVLSNHGLLFFTNNTGAAAISAAGSFGIGTLTPSAAYKLDVNGPTHCLGEFISDLPGGGIAAFRAVAGNYGTILRNDGTNFYLLLTNSGDPYGTWNGLRPFTVSLSKGAVSLTDTFPNGDNVRTFGTSTARWTALWAANGAIQTSDIRDKVDIGPDDLGLPFISNLDVISYRERDDALGERRRGLAAQQVLELLGDRPSTAIVTHDAESDRYGINYAGLVPALISAVQELAQRVAALEQQQPAQQGSNQ